MDRNHRKPSIGKIIWVDYTAFMAVVLPAAMWIIFLVWVPAWRDGEAVVSPLGAQVLLYGALLTTALGLALLGWRVYQFRALFRDGTLVRGKISSVRIVRDRGRVEYTYVFQGKKHQSGAAIHRTKETKALKANQEVILIVDRAKPTRAFIRDLYL